MAHFKRTLHAIPVVGLSFVLVAGLCPTQGYAATSAELQQQLDSAQQKLYSLYGAAEQANNDLITVTADLEATEKQIEKTKADIESEEQELSAFQVELTSIVTNQYKSGSTPLVTVLLSSNSLSSLISNIYYADKAAEHKQTVISQAQELVKSLEQKKASLESDQAKQKQLVADQKAKTDAANAAVADAQAYYDQLSDEMKAQIAAEEEAARQKAIEEAQKTREEAANNQNNSSSSNSGSNSSSNGGSNNSGTSNGGSNSSSGSGSNSGGNTGSSGSGSSDGGSASGGGSSSSSPSAAALNMVNRAYSIIGSGYSYSGYRWTGNPSTSYFTCSGVIDYGLGLPSQSNSPESLYSKVGKNLTKNVSKLKVGDLIFYTTDRWCGHVGIYIGGGQVIDSIPGGGVQIRDMYFAGTFIGGGTLV